MAYIFDGAFKTITLSNQSTMSVRDVYSRWLDWAGLSDNLKYNHAFNVIGGDAIDSNDGTFIPVYAYLVNGWRIRPMPSNHTLMVTDGVLLTDGGADPFIDPMGNFVVRINYKNPVQAITVSTNGGGGATATQIANAVWEHQSAVNMAVKLAEAWGRLGLDPSKPLITGDTSISFGDIVMAMAVSGSNVTVTRQ